MGGPPGIDLHSHSTASDGQFPPAEVAAKARQAGLAVWGLWQRRGHEIPQASFSAREALAAVREAAWELPLPVIVLGGIYSGFFAVSEPRW